VTDGIMLPPGGGPRIDGGGIHAVLKASMVDSAYAATFVVTVPPGYDVGAHVHARSQEMFFVIDGQLDVLGFEPKDRSVPDWHDWESQSGTKFLRGGPGAFLFVPENTPHAFANTTDENAVVFFQSSIAEGHEKYFEELAALLQQSGNRPSEAAMADLRRRYDTEQITAIHPGD
jgi:oxalate decarboxylase/phosphoglucose isomerase-like protein (cupin superfamily)